MVWGGGGRGAIGINLQSVEQSRRLSKASSRQQEAKTSREDLSELRRQLATDFPIDWMPNPLRELHLLHRSAIFRYASHIAYTALRRATYAPVLTPRGRLRLLSKVVDIKRNCRLFPRDGTHPRGRRCQLVCRNQFSDV
jgi:hypothetical protein